MHTVEITKDGVEHGSVSFRGITLDKASADAAETNLKSKRLYKCSPSNCVTKDMARRIADSLSVGTQEGREDEYEWHS